MKTAGTRLFDLLKMELYKLALLFNSAFLSSRNMQFNSQMKGYAKLESQRS
jgi:hypothetical protein